MKVLFVNEKAGYFGGVEQNVADSVDGLATRGHVSWLAFGQRTDRDPDEYCARFSAVYPCRDLAAPEPAPDLARVIDDVKPDVIYVHKIGPCAFLVPWLDRIRTVRMVHDHDLCCPRRHKYDLWSGRVCHEAMGVRCWFDLAFLERAPGSRFGFRYASIGHKREDLVASRRFHRMLVGSRFMRDELVSNGFDPSRVAIVPPAVRLAPVEWTEPDPDPNMLFVGQLIRGKGVYLLLEAVAGTRGSFGLDIVGDGNARDRLRSLGDRRGLSGRVRFHGWVPRDALGGLYARARASVVPSRWPEPFGMVGLEAMHHGRPVVGFRVGGIPDWLEHEKTGFLVDEQDVAGLGRVLDRLAGDPALARRMGRDAYDSVRRRFSFADFVDQLERFLSA